MDSNHKPDLIAYIMRVVAWLVIVLPPVLVANLTLWASSVVANKQISSRARWAIGVGSFGLASVMHWACENYGWQKFEWIFIFVISFSSPQILKFMYLEFGNIVKAWVKKQLQDAITVIDKKKLK